MCIRDRINTPPAVTVAQLVDTSVPSTPLSTHPGLHSLTGIAKSAATYPARSALQRAADIYDQLPSLSGLPDTPVWVPRSVPMVPFASANTGMPSALTSPKPELERTIIEGSSALKFRLGASQAEGMPVLAEAKGSMGTLCGTCLLYTSPSPRD